MALIPAGNVPITKFADLVLPHNSSELVYGESPMWFSNDEPITDISLLKNRSLPPAAVLSLLDRKFGQAWLNGAKSIADPRFNDGADRFPLWTLTFWREMSDVVGHQMNWKRSIKWLENERQKSKEDDTRNAVNDVRAQLDTMGWKMPLTYDRGGASTVNLQQFLGTVWLNDTNIDMMFEDLATRVVADPQLADKVIVAPLAFSKNVTTTKGDYTKQNAPLLYRYEREVKEKKKEKIIFPVNVGSSHWVAAVIDFKKKTIAFGDSLPGMFNPPQKVIKGLQRWFRRQFGEPFDCDYNAMEHGVQKDGYSCGFVMFNTCERDLWPLTPIWIPRRAVLTRLLHFLKYAKNIKETPAPKSEVILAAYPELSLSVALGDHNFPDMREFALATIEEVKAQPSHSRLALTHLLNPTNTGSSRDSNSSASVMSNETADSDSDLLLGRAVWDSDSGDDSSVMHRAALNDDGSDHQTAGSDSGKAKTQRTLFGFFKSGTSRRDDSKPKTKDAKRARSESGSTVDVSVPTKKSKNGPTAPTPNAGISRSATAARDAMDALKRGEFEIDQLRYDAWKGKILKLDPLAEFDAHDIRSVRHSKCATIVKVKAPYDCTRFKAHVDKGCAVTHAGTGMSTLKQLLQPTAPKAPKTPVFIEKTPCPGITEKDIDGVPAYLRRSGALGGGSRSVFKIAMGKFKKAFSNLGQKHQRQVLDTQQHEQKWRNDHANLHVFSTECRKIVSARSPRALPCRSCETLLSSKSFKRTFKKPAPADPENYIFTNKKYRNQVLGEIYGRSIGLKDIIEEPVSFSAHRVRRG
ncbi:hypothetical protein C8R44DRAFT_622057 [Mycena epipterygia]|nr:hypothetical protein C8R44DRAFT_622057 [Mycena epipterygia]